MSLTATAVLEEGCWSRPGRTPCVFCSFVQDAPCKGPCRAARRGCCMPPVLGFASPAGVFLLQGTRLPSKTNGIVFPWCKTAPSTFPCTTARILAVNPEGKQRAESSGTACVFTKQKGWNTAEVGRRNRCTKDLGQRWLVPPTLLLCHWAWLLTQIARFQLRGAQ